MPYGQRAKKVRGSQAKQSKAGADAKLSLHLLIIITSSSSSPLQTVFVHASLGLYLLLIYHLLLLHPLLPSSTHTLSFPFCVPPSSVLRPPCIIPFDTQSHTDTYVLCCGRKVCVVGGLRLSNREYDKKKNRKDEDRDARGIREKARKMFHDQQQLAPRDVDVCLIRWNRAGKWEDRAGPWNTSMNLPVIWERVIGALFLPSVFPLMSVESRYCIYFYDVSASKFSDYENNWNLRNLTRSRTEWTGANWTGWSAVDSTMKLKVQVSWGQSKWIDTC